MTTSQELTRAERLYPNSFNKTYECLYDYGPIIKEFGYSAIVVSDDGYSGDTFVFYHSTSVCGILVIGWGSCSGCDALQGCDSYDDLNKLIDELERRIMWFPDHDAAVAYVNSPGRDGSHYAYSESWPAFRAAVCAYAA